jgi:hypothetical protein
MIDFLESVEDMAYQVTQIVNRCEAARENESLSKRSIYK